MFFFLIYKSVNIPWQVIWNYIGHLKYIIKLQHIIMKTKFIFIKSTN